MSLECTKGEGGALSSHTNIAKGTKNNPVDGDQGLGLLPRNKLCFVACVWTCSGGRMCAWKLLLLLLLFRCGGRLVAAVCGEHTSSFGGWKNHILKGLKSI